MTASRQEPLVLASASPRRRELLASIGLPCDVRPSRADEPPCGSLVPREHVRQAALAKARAGAAAHAGRLVLGADTVVATGDEPDDVLGKPSDEDDARRMLHALGDRSHVVLTGVALARHDGSGPNERSEAVRTVATTVWFGELPDALVRRYVATGEPADKAGAYAVQGLLATHVARLEGSWSNVVGLPLEELPAIFAELGEQIADWQSW